MRGCHHDHRAPGGSHDLTQHTDTRIADNQVITEHQLAQRRPTPADTHQEVIDTPTPKKAQSDPPPQRITRTSYTTPRDLPKSGHDREQQEQKLLMRVAGQDQAELRQSLDDHHIE